MAEKSGKVAAINNCKALQPVVDLCLKCGARVRVPMSKIFINYRRTDSDSTAGRLHDALGRTFGFENLFMDIDSMRGGDDFELVLARQVSACDIFLAIIGPNWLGAQNDSGQRRLEDPNDYVATEIAAALKRDIPVVPTLVDGARFPSANQLPESIRALARRHAVEVRNPQFRRDADELVKQIRFIIKSRQAWRTRWLFAATILVRRRWRVVAAAVLTGIVSGLVTYYTLLPLMEKAAVETAAERTAADKATAEKAEAEKVAAKAAADKATAEKAEAEKAAADKAAAAKAAADKAAAEKAEAKKAEAEKAAAKAAADKAAAERAAAEKAAADKAAAAKAAADKAAAEKAEAEKAAAAKAAADKAAAAKAAAAPFACEARQVTGWLEQNGAYGAHLNTSIYADKVQWIASGKPETKTPSDIANDEEAYRKIFPVQKYTTQTASTKIVGGQCVITQDLQSYKERKDGTPVHGIVRVVHTIATDTKEPRIVAQQIEVLPRR
jgi:hypothetical protein